MQGRRKKIQVSVDRALKRLRTLNERATEDELLEHLKTESPKEWYVLFAAYRESAARNRRPVFLVDLVNLRDDGLKLFHKSLSEVFYGVSDRDVLRLRNELRSIWGVGVESMPAHNLLSQWFRWRPRKKDTIPGLDNPYSPFFPSLGLGSVFLDPKNFHAQVGQAVLEYMEQMRVCGNPDCANPYFLIRRRDQKYCEAGSCTIYGHRQSARDYWRKTHGSDAVNEQQERTANAKSKTDSTRPRKTRSR